jgi:DNA-binding CsgD family transcriptional regulator
MADLNALPNHPQNPAPNQPPLMLPLDAAMAQRLANATAAIGGPHFEAALLALMRGVCSFDTCGVMDYFCDRPPNQRLHEVDRATRKLPNNAYLSGPYVLDPMYQQFQAGAPDGVYPLAAMAPDNFEASEYFQVFYAHIGVCDDINLMHRHADGSASVVFIERRVGTARFSPADLLAVQLIWPLVRELLAQHARLAAAQPASMSDALTHRKVQHTLDNFGRSLLTERERQILFHMLGGYSAALTAQRLGVAEGTVKNHRKAVHRKLNVGSQAELFSLFINCIPYADAQAEQASDPLEAYQSRPRRV